MREVFQEWRAPEAPRDLEARLGWLLTGSVRVPVPAIILVVIAIVALLASLRKPEERAVQQTGLAGFQPVQQLKPRVVGRTYATP